MERGRVTFCGKSGFLSGIDIQFLEEFILEKPDFPV
jgi:hypothetical protein